jgi:hypothetical protein
MYRLFPLLLIAAGVAYCQTKVDLGRQGGNVDFSAALSTKPFQTGTTLPGSCATGQMFFLSNATAGSNTYGCIANVWTLQGGSGGGAWGGITGTLSAQTDLQNALNTKPTAALVTTVGSPGLDTNVASEKAVRTAIAAVVTSWGQITGTLSGQTDLQTALNSKPTATLVTTVGTPGSNSNVPSEAAVRSAINSGNPPGGGTNSLQTNSGSGTFQGNTSDTLDPGTAGMSLRYGLKTGTAGTASGGWQPSGLTSGMAGIAVADVAGNPPTIVLPTSGGTLGQALIITAKNVTCPTNPMWSGGTCDQYGYGSAGSSSSSTQRFEILSCDGNTPNAYNPALYVVNIAATGCAFADLEGNAELAAATTQGYFVIHTYPPASWDVAGVDVKVNWYQGGGASDGNIQWNAQTYCLAAGAALASSPTYNTAATATVAQPNANVEGEASITSLPITGCTANTRVFIKVFNSLSGSGGTTSSRNPQVEGFTVTFR